MDYVAARKVMVDSQVRVNDVTDRPVMAALMTVPRERFCAPDQAFAAYGEVEVEIAASRRLMQVRDLSKLIQALDPREGEKALVLAGPYAGAVLAALGVATTVQESEPAVFEVAGQALADAGVQTVVAPLGQPAGGEWDMIVSEGAVATRPTAWLGALRIGGRLAVVERSGPNGRAVLYVKGREGVSRRELFEAAPSVLAEMTPAPVFAL